jgi:hypothetical protein
VIPTEVKIKETTIVKHGIKQRADGSIKSTKSKLTKVITHNDLENIRHSFKFTTPNITGIISENPFELLSISEEMIRATGIDVTSYLNAKETIKVMTDCKTMQTTHYEKALSLSAKEHALKEQIRKAKIIEEDREISLILEYIFSSDNYKGLSMDTNKGVQLRNALSTAKKVLENAYTKKDIACHLPENKQSALINPATSVIKEVKDRIKLLTDSDVIESLTVLASSSLTKIELVVESIVEKCDRNNYLQATLLNLRKEKEKDIEDVIPAFFSKICEEFIDLKEAIERKNREEEYVRSSILSDED